MNPAAMDDAVVVKLGGSLHGDTSLVRWLDALLADPGARYVVVPGGGPFADQVRRSQAEYGFDDPTAHRMALLAMDQYGLMLCALAAAAEPCPAPEQFAGAWRRSRLPVWLPSALLEGQAGLAPDWTVTSDTIAAWLAHRIGARGLVLVKSCPLAHHEAHSAASLDALSAAGVVDAAFAKTMIGKRFPVMLVHRDNAAALPGLARELRCRD